MSRQRARCSSRAGRRQAAMLGATGVGPRGADARARLGRRRHRPARGSTSPTHGQSEDVVVELRPRRGRRTAPRGPTSTAPRSDEAARADGQRATRRPTSPRAAASVGARVVAVSTDYVFDGDADEPALRRVRPDRAASAPTGAPSCAGEAGRRSATTPTTRSRARPGCSAPAARTSSTRCSSSAPTRDEVGGRHRPDRLPDVDRAPGRPRCSSSPSAHGHRHPPHRRRRAVLVARAGRRDLTGPPASPARVRR